MIPRKPIAHCYLVVSPEYGTVIPILDDGTGPMEYGCDVVYAFARNAQRAKVLGVRWFRRQGARYLRYAENPFTGVKAERTGKPGCSSRQSHRIEESSKRPDES